VPISIENLKVIERSIQGVNPAVVIHRDSLWPAKVAGSIAEFSNFSFVIAFCAKYLHAAVQRISNVERSGPIGRKMRREIELPLSDASGAELLLELSMKIEYADAMALGVRDEQAVTEDRDRARPFEMICDLKGQFPVLTESYDFA
jgi:hypothetical protein